MQYKHAQNNGDNANKSKKFVLNFAGFLVSALVAFVRLLGIVLQQ